MRIPVRRLTPCPWQAEEERLNKEKQLEQEELLARELARIDQESQRDQKMRQHIKANRCLPRPSHVFPA